MAPPRTFPGLVTADRWLTVWESLLTSARRRRGGTAFSVALTNGEATSLIRAWPGRSGTLWMPLWYQFAATAYGWNPDRSDRLDTTAKRRDSAFPMSRDLWDATREIATALDAERRQPARLDIDPDTFDDPTFQAGVRAALRDDGGMRAAGKIPVGCKDPKTGRITGPKMKCRPGFTLELVPGTPFYVCRNKKTGEHEQPTYECEGDKVYLEDPLSALARDFWRLALIVGLGYLVLRGNGRAR